ncbi:hypothetical protein BD770DRAFT_416692 [Pilaira anomala]|nr:hypothetical protein BD770DRAFT_416692 [Pilaira anomala]
MAWVEYPRSIVTMRMRQSRRINCHGEVTFMRIHGLNIPAVDARFSIGVEEIEFLPGNVPIDHHFQMFLRIHEGPLHNTRVISVKVIISLTLELIMLDLKEVDREEEDDEDDEDAEEDREVAEVTSGKRQPKRSLEDPVEPPSSRLRRLQLSPSRSPSTDSRRVTRSMSLAFSRSNRPVTRSMSRSDTHSVNSNESTETTSVRIPPTGPRAPRVIKGSQPRRSQRKP